MRANYQELMSNPARIEEILQEGARKARAIATPFIKELRQAVGLRSLGAATASAAKSAGKSAKSGKAARFVSFRDEAGQFRFRFLAADGD
jgi:tryptophanyl-tRNA synthetase